MIQKVNTYLAEVKLELAKVSWPTFPELLNSTYIVIIVSALLATFIFGVDQVLQEIMGFIIQ